MRIVVLVKQVPDTWGERTLDSETGWVDRVSGDQVIDEIDERALEVALAFKDSQKATEIVVLSMGPASTVEALRKALSMGADSAVHVIDEALAGSDAVRTSSVLAAALRTTGYDVVIAGNESTDGRGGVIPAMVAEILGLPHLGSLNSVEIAEGEVSGVRGTEYGTVSVRAALPAVVSVTESTPEARFPNFRGILSAKRKPLMVLTLAELEPEPTTMGAARSVVVSTAMRPTRTAGTKIIDGGSAGVDLAEFLVAGRLI